MKTEFLLPGDYAKANSIDNAGFTPDNSIVAIVEDEASNPIGRIAIVLLPHIEGIWIHPDHRNGTIGAKLEQAACAKLSSLGADTVLAFAIDTKLESYLERLGYTKFATAWKKEI
jgi:N-acetylglutamate synthase-like GNAT family acetyltransferase